MSSDITKKYIKYAELLDKIENNKLYKNIKINGNEKLEDQRQHDINKLKKIILEELKYDGISKIRVRGKLFKI
jgi:hypothetical protein